MVFSRELEEIKDSVDQGRNMELSSKALRYMLCTIALPWMTFYSDIIWMSNSHLLSFLLLEVCLHVPMSLFSSIKTG